MANHVNVIEPYEHLVRYAALAYHNGDGHEFQSWIPLTELGGSPHAARKVHLSTWTTHCHAHLGIRNGDTLVVAFRGTDFPMTWENVQQTIRWIGLGVNVVTDVTYRLIQLTWFDEPRVLVHEGFLRDFNELKNDLRNTVKSLFKHRDLRKIETCGHSLGGALATLCALWCHLTWPDVPVTCLTLASPRVGDENFANYFNTRSEITCYRLVIPSDSVPNIPNEWFERWIPIRFSPKAPWVRCREHGNTWEHVVPALQLDNPADDPRWWMRAWKKVSLAAHLPSGYVKTVRTMLNVLRVERALLWAAMHGYQDIVRLQLKNGARLEVKSRMGRTPLSLAAMNGHQDIVHLLLQNGAKLEAKSSMGWTPLLLAVANGHEAIIRLLLEKGAELEVKSDMGRTPLSLAGVNGHEAIIQRLREAVAEH